MIDDNLTPQQKAIAIAQIQQDSQSILNNVSSGVTIQSLNLDTLSLADGTTANTANDPTFTPNLNNNVPVAKADLVYINNLNPIAIAIPLQETSLKGRNQFIAFLILLQIPIFIRWMK